MRPVLELTIPGDPVAQPRYAERVFVHGKRVIRQRFIPNVGTPDERGRKHDRHPIIAFKALVRQVATSLYTGPLLDTPIALELLFVFQRPSTSIRKTKPNPREPRAGKPDADNCIKAVKDALNGVVWVDDARVCREVAEKINGAAGERPFTLVRVFAMEELGPLAVSVPPLSDDGEAVLPSPPQKGLFGP